MLELDLKLDLEDYSELIDLEMSTNFESSELKLDSKFFFLKPQLTNLVNFALNLILK